MDFFRLYLTRQQATLTVLAAASSAAAVAVVGRWFGAVASIATATLLLVLGLGFVGGAYVHYLGWGTRQQRLMRAIDDAVGAQGLWAGLSPDAGAPDFLLTLLRTIQDRKPRLVVELGAGLSTLVIGRALQQAGCGRLLSIEDNAAYAGAVQAQVTRLGLSDCVELKVVGRAAREDGRRRHHWYDLSTILPIDGKVDVLVIDGPAALSDPTVREPAIPVRAPYRASGAVGILDDAKRGGEKRILKRWQKLFPEVEVRRMESERGIALISWPRGNSGSKA